MMKHPSERSTRAQRPVTQARACVTSHPFQSYVDQHQLAWLAVAREAGVRCATFWNIAHGIAVPGASAMRVRLAVHRLSGVAYSGPMLTSAEPAHVQEHAPRPTTPRKGAAR